MKLVPISDIKTSNNNPRYIDKDDYQRLLQSLKTFPQMLWIRPIVAKNSEAIAGNMKHKAISEIFRMAQGKRLALHNDIEQKIWSNNSGLSDTQKQEAIEQANTFLLKMLVPVYFAENLTDEQVQEFMIKDNTHFGKWDFDSLANDWDELSLKEWGVELPSFDVEEEDEEKPQKDNSKGTKCCPNCGYEL